MNPYRFGYSFVRFNKAAAAIVTLLSLGVAALTYSQTSSRIEREKYVESWTLRAKVDKLIQSYEGTCNRRISFPTEGATATAALRLPIGKLADFPRARSALTALDNSTIRIKREMVRKFESHIAEIIAKLQSHAKSLGTKEEKQGESTSVTKFVSPESFYSASVDKAEVSERVSTLNDASAFLLSLSEASENPENKQKLRDSISDIKTFASQLSASIIAVEVPAIPKAPMRAEAIAAQLSRIRENVVAAVLASWSVDDALQVAMQSLMEEQENARRADAVSASLWQHCLFNITGAILGGLILAFALLIVSDLIKAVLDIAVSTRGDSDQSLFEQASDNDGAE